MTTDTTERGLERLVCQILTGGSCDPPTGRTVGEPPVGYGGVGWSVGNHHDLRQRILIDLVELRASLNATNWKPPPPFACPKMVPPAAGS